MRRSSWRREAQGWARALQVCRVVMQAQALGLALLPTLVWRAWVAGWAWLVEQLPGLRLLWVS